VTMRQPMVDAKTGEQYIANDLEDAKFDVWVDVGPSSSSKRSATVRALTGMASISDDPEQRGVLTAAAIMQMDGEGLQDIRDFFRRKLVRMGVIKPTDEEREELAAEAQGRGPDPQAQYLQAAAEQAVADAAKKRADTIETIASADLKRAQTAKTIAETDGAQPSQFLDAAEAFRRAAQPPERGM